MPKTTPRFNTLAAAQYVSTPTDGVANKRVDLEEVFAR